MIQNSPDKDHRGVGLNIISLNSSVDVIGVPHLLQEKIYKDLFTEHREILSGKEDKKYYGCRRLEGFQHPPSDGAMALNRGVDGATPLNGRAPAPPRVGAMPLNGVPPSDGATRGLQHSPSDRLHP